MDARIVDGKRVYGGRDGGMFKGSPEDETRCIEEVSDYDSRWAHYGQCSRKRGFGIDGLYCKQHALTHPEAGEEPEVFLRYEVGKYDKEPRTLRCIKETESQLVLEGGSKKKRSTWETHVYDTWEAAHSAMVGAAKRDIADAQKRLESLEKLTGPKE
jgi:hypothetical protein